MRWMLQWEEEVARLDELLAFLIQAPASPESDIAQEHLQSARSCLWDGMSDECEFNLKLARRAIARIDDDVTRRNAQTIFARLPSARTAKAA